VTASPSLLLFCWRIRSECVGDIVVLVIGASCVVGGGDCDDDMEALLTGVGRVVVGTALLIGAGRVFVHPPPPGTTTGAVTALFILTTLLLLWPLPSVAPSPSLLFFFWRIHSD
jgi:hypothetical protein